MSFGLPLGESQQTGISIRQKCCSKRPPFRRTEALMGITRTQLATDIRRVGCLKLCLPVRDMLRELYIPAWVRKYYFQVVSRREFLTPDCHGLLDGFKQA